MDKAPTTVAAALAAFVAPLRFAARHDFTNLDRLPQLARTLRQAAERLVAVAACDSERTRAAALLVGVPDDTAPADQRVAQLRQCLEGAEFWLANVGSGPAGGRANDQALVARGVGLSRETRGVSAVPLSKFASSLIVPANAGDPAAPAPLGGGGSGVGVGSAGPGPARESNQPEKCLAWDQPVQFIRGVGPKLADLLAQRDIKTVGDLLWFLPRGYEDRQAFAKIGDLQAGSHAIVEGTVRAASGRRQQLEVQLDDESGRLQLVWFRVPGRGFKDRFAVGRRLRVSGDVRWYRGALQMAHPEVTGAEDDADLTDTLLPRYLEIPGLRPPHLRRIMTEALASVVEVSDPIPVRWRERRHLPDLHTAIVALHRPPQGADVADLASQQSPWHQRLIYEELLVLQLAVLWRRGQSGRELGRAIDVPSLEGLAAHLYAFPLTGAQRRALAALAGDLRQAVPMRRLLQGDVGSGKTAVALTLAAAVAKAGLQSALMVPTEVLAEQHARVAEAALTKVGLRVALLTSRVSGAARSALLHATADGSVDVVVGTHALIQDDVAFKSLALGIIDEQHRFGVVQRAVIIDKGKQSLGVAPHLLVMTATPIPRTLSMTLYGDLDVALIDELPPGRTPIKTKLFREKGRDAAYAELRSAVEGGRQAYVVFPLVEESDKEGMERIRDATSEAEALASGLLQGLRLGLLHGRMSGEEKQAVMDQFKRGDLQVLVATTVIEVGVDVANATIMLIEHAERFGLSQLHQLRGRVGRGQHASQCLLVAQYTPSEEAWERLQVMTRTTDGFVIAEADLKIRGPGDLLGTRQAGMPGLTLADLRRDQKLLYQAREDAECILRADASLALPEHAGLRRLLFERWRDRLALAAVG